MVRKASAVQFYRVQMIQSFSRFVLLLHQSVFLNEPKLLSLSAQCIGQNLFHARYAILPGIPQADILVAASLFDFLEN